MQEYMEYEAYEVDESLLNRVSDGDGYSSSRQFLAEVIESVADLIAMRARRAEIRNHVSMILFGPDGSNSAQPKKLLEDERLHSFIRRAEKILALRVHSTRDKAQIDAVAFYETVISDPNATFANKIKAQENLDKIYGLNTLNLVVNTPEELARAAMDALREGSDMVPGHVVPHAEPI